MNFDVICEPVIVPTAATEPSCCTMGATESVLPCSGDGGVASDCALLIDWPGRALHDRHHLVLAKHAAVA